MLRRIIIGYGLLSVVGAAVLLFLVHVTLWLVVYLAMDGITLVGAVLFERQRYNVRVDRAQEDWQPTGERFVDPTTERLTEVFYNRATGERDYREAPNQKEA
ncbi:MAG TPA: hypothetical protein VFV38_27285 [Ktedonobacteraceae bacterium]|nr:hypothetical protein [Ktedonobacteraceae bacterium]